MTDDQDPAPDARYYRRHAPKQGSAATGDDRNPFPLPDDVRAIHAKKRGRRYIYRTGELLVRQDQTGDSGLNSLLEKWGAEPYEPDVPKGRSPQARKAQERARAAKVAMEKSDLVLYRLENAEQRRPREDVPAVVRDIRRSRKWEVWPNHVLGIQQDAEYGPATPPIEILALPDLDPRGTAGKGLTVAVIDTGIRPKHMLLDGHCRTRRGDVDLEVLDEDDDGDRDFVAGHGTFVAGVIRQYAPGATVVARGTVRANGTVSDVEVAGAVDDLAENEERIDILNLSLGGYSHGDDADGKEPRIGSGSPTGLPCTATALDRLRRRHPGVVVVAAAGNDRRTEEFFPAAMRDVIGVGALDRHSRRAWFSNHGKWVKMWQLGVDIESSYVGPDISQLGGGSSELDAGVRWSGTSFAAPRFAGLLAAAMRP